MQENEKEPLLESDDFKTREKRQLVLNLLVIGIVFIFIFTAYSGLQNLESSLNPGIGVYSLAAITGCGAISCILAPTIIKYIGAKGALMISAFCLALFVSANFYPKDYVLLPAAAIYGLTSGCMLTAQGTYVTTIAIKYADITKERVEAVISRFFGMFCMAFQSSQIWGNLISSLVLQTGSQNASDSNSSLQCGAAFCPGSVGNGNLTGPLTSPPTQTLHVLIFVYIGCALAGFLTVLFFLKPIRSTMGDDKTISLSMLLGSTLRLLFTEANMAMLVPIAMYSGVEQVVMYVEYTQAYVACELGPQWIGYTMICFGVVNTLASPVNGVLAKYLSRPLLFVIAFLVNSGLLVLLRLWSPDKDQFAVFFVIPGAWAVGDAIWQTQTSALVGHAFPSKQEPAFANIRMFEAFGFLVVYLYSNYVCQDIKLYVVGVWLVLSVVLVLTVEYRIKRPQLKYRSLSVTVQQE